MDSVPVERVVGRRGGGEADEAELSAPSQAGRWSRLRAVSLPYMRAA
jgi:hypothetical protein